MTLSRLVLDYAYRNRIVAKRVIAALNKVLPDMWGRRLRGIAEQVAFRAVPAYQGETLPPIFHYWSEKYVRPMLSKRGFESPEDFYLKRLLHASGAAGRKIDILSLGAGACSMEIGLAKALHGLGIDFEFECVDFNPALMQAGARLAAAGGVGSFMRFTAEDCNREMAPRRSDVIIVNQFFHHVGNLEVMVRNISRCLAPDGAVLTSDVVGRNGHLLWPSVEAIVQDRWAQLPVQQRFDRFTEDSPTKYHPENHAAYSNEGVRAQDITRVLGDQLDFEMFLTYAGTVVPFVERRIGFNFDPDMAADRAFIDSVAEEDRQALASGDYPGAFMLAVLRNRGTVAATDFEPISPTVHVDLIRRQLEAR